MRLRGAYAAAIAIALVLALLILWPRKPAVSSVLPSHIAMPRGIGPRWAYPDPVRTPGAINPDITQANIGETICNPDWSTRSIRPPESYIRKLKEEQIRDWRLPGGLSDYEEDHFISLELGGSPTDPRNLWPEPYSAEAGAREKDVVERYLHKQVCRGAMTLAEAQEAIVTDWYSVYLQIHR